MEEITGPFHYSSIDKYLIANKELDDSNYDATKLFRFIEEKLRERDDLRLQAFSGLAHMPELRVLELSFRTLNSFDKNVIKNDCFFEVIVLSIMQHKKLDTFAYRQLRNPKV